jgi:NAD(P)-dependent dehydrogenase (short-subunit alcohol dehydrogenase family)
VARSNTGLDLKGAVVLITGAAGGIGSALADAFERDGALAVRTDLAGTGGTVPLDVTDLDATRALMRNTVDRHGRLDVVIANAGIGVGGLLDDLSDTDWDRTIAVNITGATNTLRAAYPIMSAAGRGSIVLMSSLAGAPRRRCHRRVPRSCRDPIARLEFFDTGNVGPSSSGGGGRFSDLAPTIG